MAHLATLLCTYFFFRCTPAVPQWANFFPQCTNPAVPLFFYALTLLRPYFTHTYPAVRLIFFGRTYPAAPLLLYSLTLLCTFFFAHNLVTLWLHLFFFSRTLTLLCHYLALCLPCCELFFFARTYPAVPFFFARILVTLQWHLFFFSRVHLPCCAIIILLYAYPAVHIFFFGAQKIWPGGVDRGPGSVYAVILCVSISAKELAGAELFSPMQEIDKLDCMLSLKLINLVGV